MNLKLIPISEHNYNQAKELHISQAQLGSVETVEECLKEAQTFSLWKPVMIVDGDVPIGFAMYGQWINEGECGRVWLDRFFIDEHYQGKGYAKQVLLLLINKIYLEYNCDEIYLSVYASNQVAIKIYESLGFAFNGELDINKEKVMVLKGKPSSNIT